MCAEPSSQEPPQGVPDGIPQGIPLDSLPPGTVVGEGKSYIACEKCDALFQYPEVEEGESAVCYYCGFALFTKRPNSLQRSAAWAVSAALLFVVANFFPFMTLSVGGQQQGMVLFQSVEALAERDYTGLATAVAIFILAAPTILLAGMLYVLVPLLGGRRLPGVTKVARWVYGISVWNMSEVFLLGVLVSLLKLIPLASITLGISFWAFTLMIMCITASNTCIGKHELWELIEEAS